MRFKVEEATYHFGRVDHFCYLGSTTTDQHEMEAEVKARTVKENKCAGMLQRLMRDKNISRKAKIRAYKIVMSPTENWTLAV